ncbi:MAG: hypothetical protein GY859_33510 [Desulfobacterales bacterium]|nr:hypothetical protein [Desulfobacterales bacterium]
MMRHIKSCLPKHLVKNAKKKPKNFLHLHVIAADNSDFFLHLLITESATFAKLDSFLRATWVECCGHLSAFSHERFGDEISMGKKLKDVFLPGTELIYQYDFGSTTELIVKAAGHVHGVSEKNEMIQIMARNRAPVIPCDECGNAPAVQICTECAWDDNGWLCEKCAESHECGDEMFLPVVNSPRTGVCGYTG